MDRTVYVCMHICMYIHTQHDLSSSIVKIIRLLPLRLQLTIKGQFMCSALCDQGVGSMISAIRTIRKSYQYRRRDTEIP